MLATYENRLTQDATVPESGRALDSKRQELLVSVGTLARISSGQMRGAENLCRFGCPQCPIGSCKWRHMTQIPAANRFVEIGY